MDPASRSCAIHPRRVLPADCRRGIHRCRSDGGRRERRTWRVAAFGMGVLFWVVIFTIVLARLAVVGPLPDPLDSDARDTRRSARSRRNGMARPERTGHRRAQPGPARLDGLHGPHPDRPHPDLPSTARSPSDSGLSPSPLRPSRARSSSCPASRGTRVGRSSSVVALSAVSILILAIAVRSVADWRKRPGATQTDVDQLVAADDVVERAASGTQSHDARSNRPHRRNPVNTEAIDPIAAGYADLADSRTRFWTD